jgi:hypothetical protein
LKSIDGLNPHVSFFSGTLLWKQGGLFSDESASFLIEHVAYFLFLPIVDLVGLEILFGPRSDARSRHSSLSV